MLIAEAVLAVKVERRIRIMCTIGIFRKMNNHRRLKPCPKLVFFSFYLSALTVVLRNNVFPRSADSDKHH